MSVYLEIPDLPQQFPYSCFTSDGMGITYPHWHKEIEIIYAARGNVQVGIRDNVITLAEGEVIFFASGEPHYFLAAPNSERYVYQFDVKLFDEPVLRKEEESLLTLFEQYEGHSLFWPQWLRDEAIRLLLELHDINEQHPIGENYLIMANLQRLIAEFYRGLPRKQQTVTITPNGLNRQETLQRLDKIFEYIENEYREVITIEDVAQHVGFSPYYFTRFFKKHTGQTFMQFLTAYRINQAKFILASKELPMVEVAVQAGFASVKTFHHVFKESVGQSPLQYQKQMMK